jgi:hypothetical protein
MKTKEENKSDVQEKVNTKTSTTEQSFHLEPIKIVIKNCSEDAVENVKLFNFNHEKERDLRYYCDSIPYSELLNHLIAFSHKDLKFKIGLFQANSPSNTNEQMSVGFTVTKQERMGSYNTSIKSRVIVDPMQNQSTIANVIFQGLAFTVEDNVIFDKIYPNTTIQVNLYFN